MKAEKIRPILNDYAYTSNIDWKELYKLERLAEIGKAVEWVVNNSKYDVNYDLMYSRDGIFIMVREYRKEQGDA